MSECSQQWSLEERIKYYLDQGVTSVPELAGHLQREYAGDSSQLDGDLSDLIGTINRVRQEYSDESQLAECEPSPVDDSQERSDVSDDQDLEDLLPEQSVF